MNQSSNLKENQKDQSSFESTYVITDILNKSQRNEVYLAKSRTTKEHLVIKISRQSTKTIKESNKLSAIESEFNLLRSLQHKNIVEPTQLGYLQSKGNQYQYITYPYAEFGCLIDFFSKKSIKNPSKTNLEILLSHQKKYSLCRTFFKNILDAVDNCFKNGMCHRDIKLDNILVNRNYELILADFDLSSKFIDDTGKKHPFKNVVGSQKYFAPEIWDILEKKDRQFEYDGQKADIFSLGVLLFGLVCGKMPFENSKKKDQYYYLLYKGCSKLFWEKHECEYVDDEVKILIESMLDYYPSRRPSMQELMENWWINEELLNISDIKEILG